CYDSSSTVSRCSSIFLRRPPPRSTLFPYTTLFRSLPRPDPVDAVSQLKLMIAKLPANSDASDALRSYSLSWMIHLVGDLHQPLRSEEHTSELQSHLNLVCRLLLEKKNTNYMRNSN